MANQYKFVGTDNSTSGSAINPFGTGGSNKSVIETIRDILKPSAPKSELNKNLMNTDDILQNIPEEALSP